MIEGEACVHRVANASPRCLVCMAGREDFTARGKNTALLRFVKRVARVGVVVVLKKIGFKVSRSSIYRRSNKLQRKVPMQ